jgi:hypothetical protein
MFNASDLYSDFNPEDFTDEDDQAMQLPAYELFDFGASYKLDIAGETIFLEQTLITSLITSTLLNQEIIS